MLANPVSLTASSPEGGLPLLPGQSGSLVIYTQALYICTESTPYWRV